MCKPDSGYDPTETQPEWHEPFPEPQTIPAGWDVSAMSSGEPLAVEMKTGSEE